MCQIFQGASRRLCDGFDIWVKGVSTKASSQFFSFLLFDIASFIYLLYKILYLWENNLYSRSFVCIFPIIC